MMRRTLRSGALLFVICFASVDRAEAGLWDWIEELNGPGPSRGVFAMMANIHCFEQTSRERALAKPVDLGLFDLPTSADAPAACIFFDQRILSAPDNDPRFYPVDIKISEIGTSFWVHPAFEIGAGVGVLRWNSENEVTGQEFNGHKWVLSFPRVVFKPLLAVRKIQNPKWGFAQLYFKESLIFGTLRDEDFASKQGTDFERRHQRVESMGLYIDFNAATRVIMDLLRH